MSTPPAFVEDARAWDDQKVTNFLLEVPDEVYALARVGYFNGYPAVVLPADAFTKVTVPKDATVVDMGNLKAIVFASGNIVPQATQNVGGNPAESSQAPPATTAQASTTAEAEQSKNSLTLGLFQFIPGWMLDYMVRYGTPNSPSMSEGERRQFAEKVWSELEKNFDVLLTMMDIDLSNILPNQVYGFVAKFPSEYKGSRKETVVKEDGTVEEKTTRDILSSLYNDIRSAYLSPFEQSIAPTSFLDLRILNPMDEEQLREVKEAIAFIVELYKDAYLVQNMAKGVATIVSDQAYVPIPQELEKPKSRETEPPKRVPYVIVKHGVPVSELKPLTNQAVADAFKEMIDAVNNLWDKGLLKFAFTDMNNVLIAPSIDRLNRGITYNLIKLKIDTSKLTQEDLREIKTLAKMIENGFFSEYGATIVEAKVNPLVINVKALKTIIRLLNLCPSDDDACMYRKMTELRALPADMKKVFVDTLVKEMGRNAFYRLQYINTFAQLFALINFFKHINAMAKESIKNAVLKHKLKDLASSMRNLYLQ